MFGVLHGDKGIQPKIQADAKENVAGGAKGFGRNNVFDIARCCICDQVLRLSFNLSTIRSKRDWMDVLLVQEIGELDMHFVKSFSILRRSSSNSCDENGWYLRKWNDEEPNTELSGMPITKHHSKGVV